MLRAELPVHRNKTLYSRLGMTRSSEQRGIRAHRGIEVVDAEVNMKSFHADTLRFFVGLAVG